MRRHREGSGPPVQVLIAWSGADGEVEGLARARRRRQGIEPARPGARGVARARDLAAGMLLVCGSIIVTSASTGDGTVVSSDQFGPVPDYPGVGPVGAAAGGGPSAGEAFVPVVQTSPVATAPASTAPDAGSTGASGTDDVGARPAPAPAPGGGAPPVTEPAPPTPPDPQQPPPSDDPAPPQDGPEPDPQQPTPTEPGTGLGEAVRTLVDPVLQPVDEALAPIVAPVLGHDVDLLGGAAGSALSMLDSLLVPVGAPQ